MLARLPSWTHALESLAESSRGKDLLTTLLRYVAKASRDLHLSEFRAILQGQAPTAEAVTMTIAEQLHAEGRAVGKADSVLVLLRAHGLLVTPDVQRRIESCTEAETLERWLVRAATASTAADIFED